jgi:hypothetical protein
MEDDGAGDVVGTERHKARTADPNMPEENIGTTETP